MWKACLSINLKYWPPFSIFGVWNERHNVLMHIHSHASSNHATRIVLWRVTDMRVNMWSISASRVWRQQLVGPRRKINIRQRIIQHILPIYCLYFLGQGGKHEIRQTQHTILPIYCLYFIRQAENIKSDKHNIFKHFSQNPSTFHKIQALFKALKEEFRFQALSSTFSAFQGSARTLCNKPFEPRESRQWFKRSD